MSKRNRRRESPSITERAEANVERSEGLVFSSEANSADIWKSQPADGLGANESNAIMDGMFGETRVSADELERQLERSIVPTPDGDMQFGRLRLTSIGLGVPEDVSEQELEDVGRVLLRMEGAIQWLLGDWINVLDDRKWGDTYKALAEQFGREPVTLYDYASVARHVNFSLRNETLSFNHHRAVTSMDEETQWVWLSAAAEYGWSVKTLRQGIKLAGSPDEFVALLQAEDAAPAPQRAELPKYWRRSTWSDVNPKQLQKLTPEQAAELEAALDAEEQAIRELRVHLANLRKQRR